MVVAYILLVSLHLSVYMRGPISWGYTGGNKKVCCRFTQQTCLAWTTGGSNTTTTALYQKTNTDQQHPPLTIAVLSPTRTATAALFAVPSPSFDAAGRPIV